jgi:integrase
MPLSALAVRNAKPTGKPYKLADGGGLYLLVTPTGSRLWRLDYRFGGKRKTLALGAFPDVSVADARDARETARKQLRGGTDPSAAKRKSRQSTAHDQLRGFNSVAQRWFDARRGGWVEGYADRIWSRIKADILPSFGTQDVSAIAPDAVLTALRAIEARGAVETAHRVRNYLEDIFRYAKAEGLVQVNPAVDLSDALATPPPPKRRTAIKAQELPGLLTALKTYDGEVQTRLAIQLALLTFVRTSELRYARIDEFEGLDGTEPLWRIPAERMKMRNPHLVPLASQAVTVVTALTKISPGNGHLFPARSGEGAMSENTMLYALYRMGYHSRATIHGFRGTASTILNEKGFNRDWIERQLAHVERDDVRAAYNTAEWLPQRREMMSWWADYLEGLERGCPAA